MGRLDPAALAFHAIALGVVAVLCVVLFLNVRSDPAPAAGLLDNLKKMLEGVVQTAKRSEPAKPPPTASPKAPAQPKAPTQKAQTSALSPAASAGVPAQLPLPTGRVWRYNIALEPPQWRDAVLVYRTAAMTGGTAVYTEFTHAGGKMNFQLGTFVANHPSHANVRFPGFFMHAAYLDKPLEVGQRFAWEWPWQLAGGATKAGRVKRYAGEVKAWENVTAPIGTSAAARIETTVSYIEDGRVHASARETLWYAPSFQQFIKVVREGSTPDEGAKRIVAELAALR